MVLLLQVFAGAGDGAGVHNIQVGGTAPIGHFPSGLPESPFVCAGLGEIELAAECQKRHSAHSSMRLVFSSSTISVVFLGLKRSKKRL